MFSGKCGCSNKIAKDALDIFAPAKERISKGITKVQVNLTARKEAEKKLLAELEAIRVEIAKDEENILLLASKKDNLEKFIL